MEKTSAAALAFAALFLFLLAASSLYLLYQKSSLEQQLYSLEQSHNESLAQIRSLEASQSQLESEIRKTNNELSQAKSNLATAASDIAELERQAAEKERQLNESKVDLEAQKAKAAEIASSLSSLEMSINDSLSWFKENAALPENYSWKSDIFQKRVLQDCVDGGELNLACVSYDMENTAFSIHYRSDTAKGVDDHLQGVKETINLGWGDCEDYSLIFKATLNSIRNQSPGLSLYGWQSGGEGKFRVYPKESLPLGPDDEFWYLSNAKKAYLGSLDSLHAYVVCFAASPSAGHCTVALSENSIPSSAEIGRLSGAYVFEPQDGGYMGQVGKEFTVCGSDECLRTVHAIQLVIADGELYKFVEGEGWVGYSDYLVKVDAAKSELQG